jgi:hypothetical protein
MKNSLMFVSTCPVCGQQQLQHAHTRRALIRSIEMNEIIDAYCLECDLVWPINTQERVLIASAIAVTEKQRVATGGSYGPAAIPSGTNARFAEI